jgi:acyl transferase domain-containing protein
VVLVDAACASSLYAVDLGMRSLRTMQSDLVIVGGVFTPGASWQPLYSLFEGMIGSGSFPFEQRADGVVFGEGAAVLALRRLRDAMDGNHRIHGVIRGVGLSSDGKKASVSEPNAAGQVLAIRRAYENADVDVTTVQFIEGYGVSNPASDAAELDALRTMFADSTSTLSPRPVESVKALVGHTVWAAGAASVVKVCRALKERVVPPQKDFVTANPAAHLESSGLQIPPSARSWPPNADGVPRRAGVSAFGLGGTNAHAVVEAWSQLYHRRLADRLRPETPRSPIAVVGVAGMFASNDESLLNLPSASPGAFHSSALSSAVSAELRPEVLDQLDTSQLVSVAGVEKALAGLANWRDCRARIGVVVGMVGRTARARAASERIYREELRRLLTSHFAELGIEDADAERIARTLYEITGASTVPVTERSLMGLLPNIAAARVGSMFDLQGPNLVIDAGGRSVLEVLDAAERWLTCGTTDVMLACMLRLGRSGNNRAHDAGGEGALVISLTTRACAREHGWTILGELAVGARGAHSIVAQPVFTPHTQLDVVVSSTRPVAGLDELARALDAAMHGGATVVRWDHEVRAVATQPRSAIASS